MGFIRHHATGRVMVQLQGAPQGQVIPYFLRVEIPDPNTMSESEFLKIEQELGEVIRQETQNSLIVNNHRLMVRRAFDALVAKYPDRHIVCQGMDIYIEHTVLGDEVREVLQQCVEDQEFLKRLLAD